MTAKYDHILCLSYFLIFHRNVGEVFGLGNVPSFFKEFETQHSEVCMDNEFCTHFDIVGKYDKEQFS